MKLRDHIFAVKTMSGNNKKMVKNPGDTCAVLA